MILYKLTTRERPEWAERAVRSIIDNAQLSYEISITLDYDDPTKDDLRDRLHGIPLTYYLGNSNNKIHAVNRGVPSSPWDIIVSMSDDQVFIKKGFDLDIWDAFNNDFNQVLYIPDQQMSKTGTELMTMSIIGRDYYDNDGYIYHPDYVSFWSDNEATIVAKQRGKLITLNERLFDHLHPVWGLAENDELYLKNNTNEQFFEDKRTFLKRQANGFT